MNIDSIRNGIVIDHIKAGQGMEIYHLLNLETLDCSIALIKNACSGKVGKKDIIKIDSDLNLNLDVLGYINPEITINIIKDGQRIRKFHPQLPERLTNVIKCKNPRCITSVEQEIDHIFKLTDRENRIYRCVYCESKAKSENI
ncbi:MAG: aspartate carbamoyltransferase regulatory subunit [Clostridia bacterium]|nr:aspartate carbamoyltransferase regulatory subunit [Anaerotignum sp.]NCC14864.1 aspartate carbamoyltransferase regulatory subunit [Clostridia bacterium]